MRPAAVLVEDIKRFADIRLTPRLNCGPVAHHPPWARQQTSVFMFIKCHYSLIYAHITVTTCSSCITLFFLNLFIAENINLHHDDLCVSLPALSSIYTKVTLAITLLCYSWPFFFFLFFNQNVLFITSQLLQMTEILMKI